MPRDQIEMPKRRPVHGKSHVRTTDLQKQDPIDNSVFDATGQLIVVHSRRAEIPQYAITNGNGEILRFVSMKDGSSLAKLVNSEVGILGKKGFLRSLNKPHIVAERVLLLQR
jgi:hypothetical protein